MKIAAMFLNRNCGLTKKFGINFYFDKKKNRKSKVEEKKKKF